MESCEIFKMAYHIRQGHLGHNNTACMSDTVALIISCSWRFNKTQKIKLRCLVALIFYGIFYLGPKSDIKRPVGAIVRTFIVVTVSIHNTCQRNVPGYSKNCLAIGRKLCVRICEFVVELWEHLLVIRTNLNLLVTSTPAQQQIWDFKLVHVLLEGILHMYVNCIYYSTMLVCTESSMRHAMDFVHVCVCVCVCVCACVSVCV